MQVVIKQLFPTYNPKTRVHIHTMLLELHDDTILLDRQRIHGLGERPQKHQVSHCFKSDPKLEISKNQSTSGLTLSTVLSIFFQSARR